MKPISLKRDDYSIPMPEMPDSCPRVFLDHLSDVDLPEEGEIRFRYSRIRKTTTEEGEKETSSYELKLKAITDICDCKGRDAENNEEEEDDEEMDSEEALEKLMEDLSEDDMEDESEDDNPEKY